MEKIRIGNEFVIRWSVTLNGEETDLSTIDLKIVLVSPSGKLKTLDVSLERNVIVIKIGRNIQKEAGIYRLEAWINKGEDGQAVTDYCNAFCLVNYACQEGKDEDRQNLEIEKELILSTSNIQMGVTGKSAYQIWIENGNEGTEQDFLSWIKKPSEDAAAKAERAATLSEESASLASQAAERANTASEKANQAATDANTAFEKATQVTNEAVTLINTLKEYEQKLENIPSFEKMGETNEIII